MPPTYICVGALDLFLEEDIEYARRLTRAGVPTELHVYPGGYHGFNMVPEAQMPQAYNRDILNALGRAFRRSEPLAGLQLHIKRIIAFIVSYCYTCRITV